MLGSSSLWSKKIEPMHAGQVTTLLFKLDTKDIWDLIESPTKLELKVAETMAALTSDPLDRDEVLPEEPRGAHFATTSPIPEQALLSTNLPAPPPGLGHQQPTLLANLLPNSPSGLGFLDPSGAPATAESYASATKTLEQRCQEAKASATSDLEELVAQPDVLSSSSVPKPLAGILKKSRKGQPKPTVKVDPSFHTPVPAISPPSYVPYQAGEKRKSVASSSMVDSSSDADMESVDGVDDQGNEKCGCLCHGCEVHSYRLPQTASHISHLWPQPAGDQTAPLDTRHLMGSRTSPPVSAADPPPPV